MPVAGVQGFVKCAAGSTNAARCAAFTPGSVPRAPASPGVLQAAPIVPVRKQPPLGPVTIHRSEPGAGNNPGNASDALSSSIVQIIDVGKNMAGVCQFQFHGGKAGDQVTIRYGEILHTEDGSLNAMTSVAGQIKSGVPQFQCAHEDVPPIAFQEDRVILSAAETVTFEPKFCWHAFRYAAVPLWEL